MTRKKAPMSPDESILPTCTFDEVITDFEHKGSPRQDILYSSGELTRPCYAP